MPNKSLDLLQHSYETMVNDDANYQPLIISEDTMLNNNYEPVVVNGHDKNFDDFENNEIVQEIYDTDIEHTSNIWRHNSIRYLIYCWSQLRETFATCPDKRKKALWQVISERMVERGFYFDAQACENKWRGLKKVYVYNKNRTTKKDGTKHIIVWAHFCDMDRAIKGIPYEISDIDDDDDDDDLKECTVDSCITTIRQYENSNLTNGRDGDKCQWTIDSTKELIRLYGKDRKKFSSVNQGGKHLLWEQVAQQMELLGYHHSANSCNDKWRNLKMTYKKNKMRATKYGSEYVKWFYFKDIDEIFKNSPWESPEVNDIITVSLNDDNSEVVDVKKEIDDHHFSNNDFQTSDTTVVENIPNNESNDNESEINTGSLEIWTEAATKCLIEIWGHYRPRFLMAPQGKKRFLWNEISEQLRLNGHNYSGVVCDRKWRLLKANYLKRKEKYKKLGVKSAKWQYFNDLDKLLGIPVETINWNMDSTMCLIECFDHHKDKFMKAATGEKLLIWKLISEEMLQNGFNYSPRACDNKWRTLKNRYNKNRMRTNRNKKVVWVYYNKIDSVLRDINKGKNDLNNDIDSVDINNQSCDCNELDEHNYIRTNKTNCSLKTDAISELKDIFKLRNMEFDQRLKEMEDNLINREKVFEDLQQQTLEALKKSNELEQRKLRLLEQLVSRLPRTL